MSILVRLRRESGIREDKPALGDQTLHAHVDGDECACATNAGTAVHNDGAVTSVRALREVRRHKDRSHNNLVVIDNAQELQHRRAGARHTVVRPTNELDFKSGG